MLFCLAVADALALLLHTWEARSFGLRVGRQGELTTHLAFADDTLLVSKTPEGALAMCREITEALGKIGLGVNQEKAQFVATLAWGRYRHILPILKQRSTQAHRFRILQSCVGLLQNAE